MELPSLAVGIGLQGKPIDRAQLNYLREKGAGEAKAKKAAAKDKELEGYRKKLFDTGAKAMNPIDRERLRTKSAEFFKTLSETEGDLDQAAISSSLFDIQEDANRANSTYLNTQKIKYNKANIAHQEGVSIIETATTPEEANSRFKMTPGSRYASVNENGVVNMPTYTYVATPKAVNEFIKGNLQSYLNPTFQGDVNKVAGKDFVTKVLKPGASEAAFAAIKNSPEMLNNAEWDYGQQLQRSGQMPDLSTPEGNAAFDAGVDDFIKGQIAINFDPRSMDVAIGQPNVTNINVAGDEAEQRVMTPFDEDIKVTYFGKPLAVRASGGSAFGDMVVTTPTFNSSKYADGKSIKNTGKQATYNYTASSYVLDEPLQTKYGEIPAGFVIPKDYEQEIANLGGKFSPKLLAWAREPGTAKWFYTPYNASNQSQFMGASKQNKGVIDRVTEVQKQMRDEMKDYYPKSKPTPKPPAPTPTPTPTGKPKNTGNPTPNPPAASKRLTPEAQAKKDALKAKFKK
jgi:hypothetical protein